MPAITAYLPALIPVTSFILSSFISCVALNVSQRYRLYFLPAILLPAILSFTTLNYLAFLPLLNHLWGFVVIIYVIHITSVLYIEKWTLPNPKQWDLHAAYKIWGNPRLLNTPQEVPNAPRMQQQQNKLSRTAFVLRRLSKLLVYYLINTYLVSRIFPDAFKPFSIVEFAPDQEVYFRRLLLSQAPAVTVRETLLRTIFAVRWIWANVIGIEYAHTGVAILFAVILRWDEPHEWPPLFGSPLEAYSIRRFWGRFWHRIVYRPYTSYGVWASRQVLRLSAGSAAEKVFVPAFVFLLSGLSHSMVTWQTGNRCSYWRDTRWFALNFVAATGETVVGRWMRSTAKTSGWGTVWEGWRRNGVAKVLGFAWVLAFFFWSVPKWEYPKIYCVTMGM
ncbi:hypothetical protein VTN96DRAFT_2116 [Rasamsonia emersonii]|uniref:Wax synthase domain-containing protein n=1 Tax=Rasamsonia emersonii (strain ATCC 16479 / CBS 393.64 / IMI 116815) TaxID=1408163 RepID=A0A0F4YJ02_RASE3|nr:hypothetical protein T310_7803 [Rasamsonia emersonii CBS 393.64]KKA18257.1 hypothetical protein T310_7803 [Rasamsonia emersonii CBS 393.64]